MVQIVEDCAHLECALASGHAHAIAGGD